MYDSLSVVLEKSGDINGALKFRKKYEMLSDSILSAKVRTNINRLQLQYKDEQKNRQIELSCRFFCFRQRWGIRVGLTYGV